MNEDIAVSEIQAAETPATSATPLESGAEQTLDSTPLRKFFYGNSTDLTDSEISDLNYIWAHYSKDSNGPGETLGRIRDLERGIAAPPQGVTRLQHILGYVQLLESEADLQKQKGAYYG